MFWLVLQHRLLKLGPGFTAFGVQHMLHRRDDECCIASLGNIRRLGINKSPRHELDVFSNDILHRNHERKKMGSNKTRWQRLIAFLISPSFNVLCKSLGLLSISLAVPLSFVYGLGGPTTLSLVFSIFSLALALRSIERSDASSDKAFDAIQKTLETINAFKLSTRDDFVVLKGDIGDIMDLIKQRDVAEKEKLESISAFNTSSNDEQKIEKATAFVKKEEEIKGINKELGQKISFRDADGKWRDGYIPPIPENLLKNETDYSWLFAPWYWTQPYSGINDDAKR